MKNKIINEDNLKIKKLVNKILKEHISNSQIVSEQSIVPRILKKLLGSRIVQKLESSKGDDVIRELESLFAKGERNLGMEAGQVAFKSATGSNIKMSQIQNGIELVLDGSHTPDEVANMFPRYLEDGTDFRGQLLSLLKKQKPKTSTVSNITAPHIPSPGGVHLPPYPQVLQQYPYPSNIDLNALYQINQYRGKTVSQIVARLKSRFPKASESKLNEMAENVSQAGARSEMEYNQMINEAIDSFSPEYQKMLSKPTAKTILGKIWNWSPKWLRWVIGLTLIGGANEFFNLFGVNIGTFTQWLTSVVKKGAKQGGEGIIKGVKEPVDNTTPSPENKKPRPY
jgi:hypothetical protein